MFLSCYFPPQITISLTPIIGVTFEIREKKCFLDFVCAEEYVFRT